MYIHYYLLMNNSCPLSEAKTVKQQTRESELMYVRSFIPIQCYTHTDTQWVHIHVYIPCDVFIDNIAAFVSASSSDILKILTDHLKLGLTCIVGNK